MTPDEWSVVFLSLRVALVAIVVSFPFAVLLGYGLARRRIPAPFFVEVLLQLPLVLPPVVTGLLLLEMLGPQSALGRLLERAGMPLAFHWTGAAVAAAVMAFPLMLQTIRAAFEQIDPDIEHSGLVSGATRWGVLRYITLPIAARGLAAGLVLGFARAVGEFGATIMFAGNIPGSTRTLPLAIYTAFNVVDGDSRVLRFALAAIALSVGSLCIHALLARRLYRVDEDGTTL